MSTQLDTMTHVPNKLPRRTALYRPNRTQSFGTQALIQPNIIIIIIIIIIFVPDKSNFTLIKRPVTGGSEYFVLAKQN